MAKPVLSAPHFHNEEAAFAFVEAHLWPDGPVCPHCGNCDEKRIGRLSGKTSRPGLRKCYACRKTFTVRIGSIFEDSHFPLHLWLQAIQLITASKKGISTRQIQRTFNCSMKTAWFLTHRIREIMKPANGGWFADGRRREDFGGRFHLRRPQAEKKVSFGHGHMNPVLALVERDGGVRSFHMPTVRGDNIHAILESHASPKSHFMTDEGAVFTGSRLEFRLAWHRHPYQRRIRAVRGRARHHHQYRRRFFLDPQARRLRRLPAR